MGSTTRLGEADVACWVIKSRTPPEQIVPGWQPGTGQTLTRCLRRSYRIELMAPGQRCLLWLSGRDRPGVHAIGLLESGAELREADREQVTAEVRTGHSLLPVPGPRDALRADPVFAGAEVLRMPAGSNPSYLSPACFAVLTDFLHPSLYPAAGW